MSRTGNSVSSSIGRREFVAAVTLTGGVLLMGPLASAVRAAVVPAQSPYARRDGRGLDDFTCSYPRYAEPIPYARAAHEPAPLSDDPLAHLRG